MHPGEGRRVAPGREPPRRVVELGLIRCLHHRVDVAGRVHALELGAGRLAHREHLRTGSSERAELLQRVVHADEPDRPQRVVLAVDVRGDALIPHEAGAGDAHPRVRSRMKKLNA